MADLVPRLVLPLGDMLLLAFVAGVMALNGWRPGRAWIGLRRRVRRARGRTRDRSVGNRERRWQSSGVVELLWPVGIALIGFAAWLRRPTCAPQIRLEGWGLLVAPTLFGWATVALVGYGNFRRLGPLGLALAGITLLLVMLRTALTFRENAAIARELATTSSSRCATR